MQKPVNDLTSPICYYHTWTNVMIMGWRHNLEQKSKDLENAKRRVEEER